MLIKITCVTVILIFIFLLPVVIEQKLFIISGLYIINYNTK